MVRGHKFPFMETFSEYLTINLDDKRDNLNSFIVTSNEAIFRDHLHMMSMYLN